MGTNSLSSSGAYRIAFRLLLLGIAVGAFTLSFWTSQRWVNMVGVASSGLLAVVYFLSAYRRSKETHDGM